jgi:hypothetical protein
VTFSQLKWFLQIVICWDFLKTNLKPTDVKLQNSSKPSKRRPSRTVLTNQIYLFDSFHSSTILQDLILVPAEDKQLKLALVLENVSILYDYTNDLNGTVEQIEWEKGTHLQSSKNAIDIKSLLC